MNGKENNELVLELFAEELPEQLDLSNAANASVSTASTTTTASCPASTLSSTATASSQ